MLSSEQQKLIDGLLASLTPEQKAWLAGYFAGVTQGMNVGGAALAAAGTAAPVSNVTIAVFYATETGNTKALAQSFAKAAKERGLKTKVTPINKVRPEDLAALSEPAVFISSTHGEGDPPDMAKTFFATLKGDKRDYSKLRYAVLGLGDRAYKQFCQTAVDLDEAFKAGGGKSFYNTALLDVDFATHVPGWLDGTLDALSALVGGGGKAAAIAKAPAPVVDGKGFSRLQPVTAELKEIVNLNDRGSNKETFHIELKLEAPLAYAPGDSAGIIMPKQADGSDLTPRLYSIASAPAQHPDEVHLTVAHASYTRSDGTVGYGVCSHYLSQLKPGDTFPIYIQRNLRFRLPEDESRDIIMVGPGTGIAPFRAFVQERAERGGSGRNWLFFGDQHAHCDFLYQAEWQEFLGQGSLHRLNAAFSRDQKQKIYVQHRMREHAKEINDWLQGGAHFYVCGAKSPMSEDVEAALLEIITTHQGKGAEAARAYLDDLAEADRYVKDVY
jgi:sulfite reductase (NADPH) flavoprotein alpha-component